MATSPLSPESRQKLQTLAEQQYAESQPCRCACGEIAVAYRGRLGAVTGLYCEAHAKALPEHPDRDDPDYWVMPLAEYDATIADLSSGVLALLSALAAQEAENERLRQAARAEYEQRVVKAFDGWRVTLSRDRGFGHHEGLDFLQRVHCALSWPLSASTPEQET